MSKIIALLVAIVSGVYLAFGWWPDPLPFIDEGLALVVFLNALARLGLDLRPLLPGRVAKKNKGAAPIDID